MSSPGHQEFVLGGQAVIEGVMMKGMGTYAVAVRKQSGEIRVRDFPIPETRTRKRLSRMPLLRGVVTMVAMLAIGVRALRFSADEAIDDAEDRKGERDAPARKDGKGGNSDLAMAFGMALALLLGVGLFFWLPLVVTRWAGDLLPALSGRLVFNVVDGVIRILVFVLYILGIGMMGDIRRIFQYHGAEHKAVHAYERGADLAPENVAGFPSLHPRCGTSFLLFVMVISIAVFSLIPHESSLLAKALMRLLLLPAVAGISYEVLRLSAKHGASGFFRALVGPGLLLQRLTTREPDLSQIEVAIASLRRVAQGSGSEGVHVG
jgi:uncharacterized protein YqhQ